MLRSLYSGISGLRAHQTMLDVTGNNIANVNTAGFKASSTQFQDTLSQVQQGATGPQAETGGTNPAQVGLGVRVAGVSTNFSQGSSQSTGRATDLMISGDGFFVTSKGGNQLFTRAGSFSPDAANQLVSPDGGVLQGWPATDGVIDAGGPVGDITLNPNTMVAKETKAVTLDGNLPSDAPDNTKLDRLVKVYDAAGAERSLTVTFTKAGSTWNMAATDNGTTSNGSVTYTDGQRTAGGNFTVNGITIDVSKVSGYATMSSLAVSGQNGAPVGKLESYTLGNDGSLIGSFSNGIKEVLAKIALAKFTNPAGLGAAGDPGMGTLTGGTLEMSNVDLSQEFTNLIVAQRGFQANARIITTSDEVLQELGNLKR
jgi:flagellar hook protein FlgE